MALVVTQDGRPLENQSTAIRLFKDAARQDERYRIVKYHFGYIAYYNGRRIYDSPEMRTGADTPGILIDQIRRIRIKNEEQRLRRIRNE